MQAIELNGRLHILKDAPESRGAYPMPNFMGTGKALHAVARKGESLKEWRERRSN